MAEVHLGPNLAEVTSAFGRRSGGTGDRVIRLAAPDPEPLAGPGGKATDVQPTVQHFTPQHQCSTAPQHDQRFNSSALMPNVQPLSIDAQRSTPQSPIEGNNISCGIPTLAQSSFESPTVQSLTATIQFANSSTCCIYKPDGEELQHYHQIEADVHIVHKKWSGDGAVTSVAGSSDVCGRDCLCSMLMSSCSSGCKCGGSCLNKPFHQRAAKKMKITEKCGSGIVADEDIKQGEFVIEYVGEVIDDKTCEERLWKMKHLGETNFYLCEINRDTVIDATYKGNKSRYINHSCCPNTEMQKWMIDGETRIGIFATCDIKKGEHLTYDYQFVQFGADQDCHCGAVGCRRKLGSSCNDSAQRVRSMRNCIGQIIRISRSSDMRSYGIIKQFDSTTRKHLIMFEDGKTEYLDLSREDWQLCNFSV
nr:histone-lysine N-methyltransferase ASHH3 [Ipomoea batatas]